ncbi:hypothetical protein [Phormidium sp. CCY1219]|uniref:hypothetical protein n=1 Tax=Phormidium sp. CCY1219 TaxID=2886104 RepID=UPI002D1F3F0C|nr:hypothetical protein [Phormidium sp. CCY1219]MEB3827801.1 hypothetical protein [Phormidium sp. CCY1219]
MLREGGRGKAGEFGRIQVSVNGGVEKSVKKLVGREGDEIDREAEAGVGVRRSLD